MGVGSARANAAHLLTDIAKRSAEVPPAGQEGVFIRVLAPRFTPSVPSPPPFEGGWHDMRHMCHAMCHFSAGKFGTHKRLTQTLCQASQSGRLAFFQIIEVDECFISVLGVGDQLKFYAAGPEPFLSRLYVCLEFLPGIHNGQNGTINAKSLC